MTVVRQNILSTAMLKNDKLSNGNGSLHLATPEICQARNLSSNPRDMLYFYTKSGKNQLKVLIVYRIKTNFLRISAIHKYLKIKLKIYFKIW